jgi:hypothetical protein
MQFDIPILFIVFNRPDTTEKVFQRIRAVKPKLLFVAADGPRMNRHGEKEKCEAVRNLIMEGIDWDCDVQTKFSDVNLGCGLAESSAMLWFFKTIDEGIVLEDDTLPDPSFFAFCKELLVRYRNDESVKIIGGSNFQNGRQRGDGSYYFSNINHCWGYASWWRAWVNYDFELKELDFHEFEKLLDQRFSSGDLKNYWKKVYKRFRDGEFDTWDYQFQFTSWKTGGVCIVPNENLVTNIGFGNNATHTVSADDPLANRPLSSINKIKHPSSNIVSDKADLFLFKNYLKGLGKWERRFKKYLKFYSR